MKIDLHSGEPTSLPRLTLRMGRGLSGSMSLAKDPSLKIFESHKSSCSAIPVFSPHSWHGMPMRPIAHPVVGLVMKSYCLVAYRVVKESHYLVAYHVVKLGKESHCLVADRVVKLGKESHCLVADRVVKESYCLPARTFLRQSSSVCRIYIAQ